MTFRDAISQVFQGAQSAGATSFTAKIRHIISNLRTMLATKLPSLNWAELNKLLAEFLNASLKTLFKKLVSSFKWALSWLRYYLAFDLLLEIFKRNFHLLVVLFVGQYAVRIFTKTVWRWWGQARVIVSDITAVGNFASIARRKQFLQRELKHASSFEEWSKTAQKIDMLEGNYNWKHDPHSPYYDHERIAGSLAELRRLVDAEDIKGIMTFLRSRMRRNVHGSDHPRLYSVLRVGTKSLIEDHVTEICTALEMVSDSRKQNVGTAEKVTFFSEIRHALGRSAFLFSGGGTFGLYHTGVLKALHEANLLPKILSGSSAGSLFAALAGSCDDKELRQLLEPGNVHLKFFSNDGWWSSLRRFFREGHFLDIETLQQCYRENIGELTFQEAYDKTGRIVNITVSPSKKNYNGAILLNYLTAPNVLLWSAASASSAIPYVFKAVELMCKNTKGEIVPYHLSGVTWVDGSFKSDLPMKNMSEMFNVNNFIVSQVNPHVLPFMHTSKHMAIGVIPDLQRYILCQFRAVFANLLDRQLNFVHELQMIRPLLSQTYRGDITLIPRGWRWGEYLTLLSNPTDEQYQRKLRQSERSTWTEMPTIKLQCCTEFTLDRCLRESRQRLREETSRNRRGFNASTAARVMSFNHEALARHLSSNASFASDASDSNSALRRLNETGDDDDVSVVDDFQNQMSATKLVLTPRSRRRSLSLNEIDMPRSKSNGALIRRQTSDKVLRVLANEDSSPIRKKNITFRLSPSVGLPGTPSQPHMSREVSMHELVNSEIPNTD